MSDHPPIGLNVGAIMTAAITAMAALGAAIIAYFGGRGSVQAQLTTAVTTGFASLTNELQEERASDRRRILALEGQVAALEQWARSMEELLRKNDIEVPSRPRPDDVVFVLAEAGATH